MGVCINTKGGGGLRLGTMSAGKISWGNFRRTSNVGAGRSDTGNVDPQTLWFLVDNQLCENFGQ